MTLAEEVLQFAKNRETWQQKLIRDIHAKGRFDRTDLNSALQNLKASKRTISVNAVASSGDAAALSAIEFVAPDVAAQSETLLLSIANARNANRLAPNQLLPFAPKGITLIFGYNGSGKTGYGRLLKKICRSREDKPAPILANAYATSAGQVASATITFSIDDNVESIAWTDGAKISSPLARISVFDSTTAPLYANEQNQIEFLPRGLDLLPLLGSACDEITKEIDREITSLHRKIALPLQNFKSDKFQAFARRLAVEVDSSVLPTTSELSEFGKWTDVQEKRTLELETEIGHLSRPAARAAQLRRIKSTLETLLLRFESSVGGVSLTQYTLFLNAFTTWSDANQAAELAARGRFGDDPLGDTVSSAAWRALYSAAERFSKEIFPDRSFPPTGEAALCILCQQPLSDEAQTRFLRFHAFVTDVTQRNADIAAAALDVHAAAHSFLEVPTQDDLTVRLGEYLAEFPENTTLGPGLKECLEKIVEMKERLAQVIRRGASEATFCEVDSTAISQLKDEIFCLSDQIKALDSDSSDSSAVSKLRVKHAELLDQQAFNSNFSHFESRLADLEELAMLKECKADCETRSISIKASSLREKYITKDYADRVEAETKRLGLGYLPIEVRGSTERGRSKIGVTLGSLIRAQTVDILSEGEFRALALACFFAEIGSIEGHSGIIVDDPVSSLDHVYCNAIAKRIVDEAKVRSQVIIFTHDLSFYYSVMSLAAEYGLPVQRNWIRRGIGEFGLVLAGESPWHAKKTTERITHLQSLLAVMPDERSSTPDGYSKSVREFYTSLRETWERLVEELLLNDAVSRFQLEVKTLSLRGVSVTDEDHRTIYFGMKRASVNSGHDQAVGKGGVPPSLDVMKNDLAEVAGYVRKLKDRKRSIEDARKLLEQPPLIG